MSLPSQTNMKSDVTEPVWKTISDKYGQTGKRMSLWAAVALVFTISCLVTRSRMVAYDMSYPWTENVVKIEQAAFRGDGSYKEKTVSSPYKKLRICDQEVRLQHMRQICSRSPEIRVDKWMTPADRSIYDIKHKLIICLMSKAGCTAIKALLFEAAGLTIPKTRMDASLMTLHSQLLLDKYGMGKLGQLTDEQVDELMRQCSVFMLIRHPFERLLSTYRGKVLAADTDFPWLAADSLRLAHPELFGANGTLAQMDKPQQVLGPPTFGQFLDWIRITGTGNDHWSRITESCHPCAHQWTAILRIETMERDGKLLTARLRGDLNVSDVPVRHSHQMEPVHGHDWIRMPEYDDVSEETIDYFLRMYEADMELFGYKWDKTRNVASCSIDTDDGPCC